MWGYLAAYPIASASAAALYAVLLALAVPSFRGWLLPGSGGRGHLAGFDAIRGLAAALVAAVHGWYFTAPVFDATVTSARIWSHVFGYGYKAVPIFCVLSGFLIYRSVLAIRSMDDLRAYFVRRIFRIYPVYVLGVALSLGFGLYVSGDGFSVLSATLASLFMLGPLGWGGADIVNPVVWSLLIEVMFYVMLPLLVVLLGRRRMVPFALAALAVCLLAENHNRSFGLWKYFAIGVLASELAPRLRAGSAPAVALGLGLLVLDFLGPEYDWAPRVGLANGHSPSGETLGLGLACGLVLAALPNLGRIAKTLDVLPLRLLGGISYSVYIVHPFFILANFPEIGTFANATNLAEHFKSLPAMPAWYLPLVFLPGALFWGLASSVLVERPGIRLGRRLVDRSRAGAAPPLGALEPGQG